MDENAKRDYKAEYKKFQSSTKSKKYRAELNKYNRKKGTYGNGDGKDASHSGGKIVGFESQSKNRGRAEKSRLKKEVQVNELAPPMSVSNPAAYKAMLDKQISKNVKVKTALGNKDHKDHKKAKGLISRFMDKFKKKKDAPKKSKSTPTSAADFRRSRKESVIEINGVKYSPVEEGFGGELKGKDKQKFEKARKENAEQLGYKVTGVKDIKESVNEGLNVQAYSQLTRSIKSVANNVKDLAKAHKKQDDGVVRNEIDNLLYDVKRMVNIIGNKKYNESVDEGQKRDSSNAYMKYYKTYETFAREVMNLAKTTTKLSGDRTDEKIILKNFKKYVIPFAGLMNSWDKGQQKNPHIDESINEAASWGQVKTFLLGIVRKKQATKMDGFKVDLQTANAILQVGNALNQFNQKKYGKLPIRKMAKVAWKLIK